MQDDQRQHETQYFEIQQAGNQSHAETRVNKSGMLSWSQDSLNGSGSGLRQIGQVFVSS
jgi:hypothetical protein